MKIGNKKIGEDGAFIIAEAGINHNGEIETAKNMATTAKLLGADAVKFQTFKKEMLPHYYLSESEFRELKKHCDEIKITFLSTPFDIESANFLNDLDVPAFKIASGYLDKPDFLKHVACFGKPVLLSTGMADGPIVAESTIYFKFDQLVLLHCTSGYPTPYNQVNLNYMKWLIRENFGPVGLSDHTLGIEVPIAAVASGACVIEKHFTFDKTQHGADHCVSLNPEEMRLMIYGIRHVEEALGDGIKKIMPCEMATIKMVKERRI